jgi:hypothetical protein
VPEFKARAVACYQAASRALAGLLRDNIAATYARDLPSAAACFVDGFAACIAHLRFPDRPSPGDPHHKSARAAVRRGAPAHQGNPACLWRACRL